MYLNILNILGVENLLNAYLHVVEHGHRDEMDSLAFEKFQNAVFFKIFKFPFNEQLEMV